MTDVDKAAETYKQATGEYPKGYTPPGQETPEDRLRAANEAYKAATGYYPGEQPTEPPFEEAPEDAFSHYLELASGDRKRFAVLDRRPSGPFPTSIDGVAVVKVHNAMATGKEASQ
jgi:hypothetical protein